MTIKTHHHCRQCRSKLRAAVESERNAFCSRDCHGRYHRRHCLVCARETIKTQSPDSHKQNFCSAKCRSQYRKNPEMYQYGSLVRVGVKSACAASTFSYENGERAALIRNAREAELSPMGITKFTFGQPPRREFPGLSASQLEGVRSDFRRRHPGCDTDALIALTLAGRLELSEPCE
jgi:hypothetical protein